MKTSTDLRVSNLVTAHVAIGKMPQRIDVGSDMGGHFDAFEVGAGVIDSPHLAAALDGVPPRPEDRHQERGLIGSHVRRAHVDLVADIIHPAQPNGGKRGQAFFHRQQVGGADLVGRSPLRMVVDHLDAPFPRWR